MSKRFVPKTATVAGVTFQGETVAAAKTTGEAAIVRFVTESKFGPSLYRVPGIGDESIDMLIWAEIEGWAYRYLEPGGVVSSGEFGFIHASCNFNAASRAEACADAVYAAAQRLWRHEVPDDEAFFVRAFGPLLDRAPASYRKVRDLMGWAGWQRRYTAAMAICENRGMAEDIAYHTESVVECEDRCKKQLGMQIPG